MQQTPGLHALEVADRRELRPCHHGLRLPVQPVAVVSLQPLRRHAREPDLQVHGRLYPAAPDHELPVPSHPVLDHLHLPHPVSRRAHLRWRAHGHARGVRCRLLHHVQAHPAPERAGGQRPKPAVRRAVRRGHQHPGREDLRARGARASALRHGEQGSGGA